MNAHGPSPSARRTGLAFGLAAILLVASSRPPPSSGSPRRATRSRRRTKISRRPTRNGPASRSYGSPLVDHLPKVPGIPSPKDVLGYHIGAPRKLTYYADIVKYYRALAAATPRVKIETIGKSDEDRELVVVWVSSDANIKNLQQNRDNLAKLADPRGVPDVADQAAHRDDEAALPPDGRPAQRRDRSVRNADGARLSARDRDVAVHHRRFATTCTCRSRRWPTRTDAIATSIGSTAVRRCARRRRERPAQVLAPALRRRRSAADRRRRQSVRAAVLGQVRLPRQQPRH